MRLEWPGRSIALILCAGVTCAAQGPVSPVHWTAVVSPSAEVAPGAKVKVELSATIDEGWHVYGLVQSPDGPTPLRVELDGKDLAQIDGAVTESAPLKKHDPTFDVNVESFVQSFQLRVPVKVSEHAPVGSGEIPISVHFQACNDRICLPPRATHVPASVKIVAAK